jgi:hypothetical protein
MNPLLMQGQQEGTNLFNIILHLVFGFVVGLILFLGFGEVLQYGSALAGQLIKLSGYGSQMAAFGMAQTAAPYIVLAPIAGLVARQLSGVRSIKGFTYFAAAVIVGIAVAYFVAPHVAAYMAGMGLHPTK